MIAAAAVAEPYRALAREGYDFGAVTRRFARFLERRWQMPLPTGPALTLFPLTLPRPFVEAELAPKVEALLRLSDQYLRSLLLQDPAAAVRDLLGEGAVALAGALAASAERPPDFLVGRPDLIVRANGEMQVLELNSGTGIGGMFWLEQFSGLYLTEPRYEVATRAAGMAFASPLRALAHELDDRDAGTVALIDFGAFEKESSGMAEYLNRFRRGGKVLYAYAPEIELTAERQLHLDGCPIDTVYLNLMPYGFDAPVLKNVWASVAAGKVRTLSSYCSAAVGSKAGLALIYQAAERRELKGELAALVAALVPPSGLLRPGRHHWQGETFDTFAFCRSHQESLVLKKAAGQQATDVYIGCTMTRAAWSQVLETAIATPGVRYVFQQFVEHPITENFYFDPASASTLPLRCRFHVSPFIFGKFAGLGARLSLAPDAHGPMSAPDLGNCSFNIVGTC